MGCVVGAISDRPRAVNDRPYDVISDWVEPTMLETISNGCHYEERSTVVTARRRECREQPRVTRLLASDQSPGYNAAGSKKGRAIRGGTARPDTASVQSRLIPALEGLCMLRGVSDSASGEASQ